MPDFEKRGIKISTVGELRTAIEGVPDGAGVYYEAPTYEHFDDVEDGVENDQCHLYGEGEVLLDVTDATEELEVPEGGDGWNIAIYPVERKP